MFWRAAFVLALALLPLYIVTSTCHLWLVSESVNNEELFPEEQERLAEQALDHGLSQWREKQYPQALKTFLSIDSRYLPEAELYKFYTKAHISDNNEVLFAKHSFLKSECTQQLLFVTGDIRSLEQTEQFRLKFAKDQRLSSLPICVHPLTWFAPETVECEQNWQQEGRMGCHLQQLGEQLKAVPFTHLVVFAEKGKANVHNGIMFLDIEDTYDVFVHELAHFSGFIDEYPLNATLAKRVCAGIDAPNIVFQKSDQLEASRQHWMSSGIHSNATLSLARTCDNHSSQAYKASANLTFMEYHDTAFIPGNYLVAWHKRLKERQYLPTAHVNFEQLYEEDKNRTESLFWHTRYRAYLAEN